MTTFFEKKKDILFMSCKVMHENMPKIDNPSAIKNCQQSYYKSYR